MKKYIKSLGILITFSTLLNSCSVYYKKEATFNEAYLAKKPAKLITKENRKVHLNRIIVQDSAYYGVYRTDGKKITFPLSEQNYRSVRIKNRTASTILNIGGSVLTLGIVTVIIVGTSLNNWDWNPKYQYTPNQN